MWWIAVAGASRFDGAQFAEISENTTFELRLKPCGKEVAFILENQ